METKFEEQARDKDPEDPRQPGAGAGNWSLSNKSSRVVAMRRCPNYFKRSMSDSTVTPSASAL